MHKKSVAHFIRSSKSVRPLAMKKNEHSQLRAQDCNKEPNSASRTLMMGPSPLGCGIANFASPHAGGKQTRP
eukprot:216837-Pyramimonas_sp.AAC.1